MVHDKEKGYGYYFGPKTLFLEFTIAVTTNMVEDACDEVRLSFPDTEIRVIAYKNVLGYWAARDIVNDKSIYCGTMSLKATKSTIYKYLENEKS